MSGADYVLPDNLLRPLLPVVIIGRRGNAERRIPPGGRLPLRGRMRKMPPSVCIPRNRGSAMKRRQFLAGSLAAGAGFWAAGRLLAARRRTITQKGDVKMPFQQPPLPFAMTAMKPFLSEEQLTYHYGKHHAAYFKNLNGLVEGKPEASMTLREVVVQSPPGPVFNNAAQAWNHSFYWDCMKPGGGGEPNGELAVGHPPRFRQLRGVSQGHLRGQREAVRLGLGLAGRRQAGQAGNHAPGQRRHAAEARQASRC